MRHIRKDIIVLLFLCLAAYRDLKTYRIRNRLIGAGLAGGLVWNLYEKGIPGILFWGTGVIIPVILLFLLFIWKVVGAGDIKLFSVIGGFFGTEFLVKAVIAAFCLGAVMSFGQMIYLGILRKRFLYLIQYVKKSIHEKKIRPYYNRETDGEECVIHFSLAILGAFCYCVRMY